MLPLRNSLIALLFGALAALGHAPFSLWWLALVGFSGLIWTVSRAERPALAAWLAGVGYFGVALHWIVEPFLVDAATHGWMAPFALIFMAGGLALFWALAGWLSARVTPGATGFALWLAAAEMARGHVLTGFPWALPGYILSDTGLRLSAAWWGPYGLTLVTLVLCALPVSGRRRGRQTALGAVSVVGFLAIWGLGTWLSGAEDAEGSGRIALVQPNAPQHEKWDPDKALGFVQRQLEFTARAVAETPEAPELIIWPETAIPWWLRNAGAAFDAAAEASGGVPVVIGLNRTEEGRNFNALAVVGADGMAGEVYDKVRLVPFGEYIPLGGLARMVGLRSFAARDGYGFSPGEAVRLIETPLGPALPLICYEAIFPQHPRGIERPRFLLQITNDAWFGTFSGPYQHLAQARFRAVEQGLPLVRVANTGVSAMIDAKGEVRVSIPLGVADVTTATLPAARPPTIYAHLGDLPVAVFLLLVIGLSAIAQHRRT